MPISQRFDKKRELTVFVVKGELSHDAPIAVLDRFFEDSPTPNVLWDLRLIEGDRLTAEELRKIISFSKQHSGRRQPGKTALVAPSDLDFGLSTVTGSFAELENLPWIVRPFRSMEEALAWIDEK